MKNPMTPEEMKQAIDDNDAGHPMQTRPIGSTTSWEDRPKVYAGDNLNFKNNEYRRKPELIKRIGIVFKNGVVAMHPNIESAETAAKDNSYFVRYIQMIENPDWRGPEPEDANPWRPIIKGEWPECDPTANIVLKSENDQEWSNYAGYLPWLNSTAIAWRYANDEQN